MALRRSKKKAEVEAQQERLQIDAKVELLPPPSPPSERLIFLYDDVCENSVSEVIKRFIALEQEDAESPIQLVISSYGGSIDEMFALYDTINLLSCPVHTFAIGKAMSASILLLASGAKGYRRISPNTNVMLHQNYVQDASMSGNHEQFQNFAQQLGYQKKMLADAIVKNTKLSHQKLQQIFNLGYDHHISAQQAVKYGIADRIAKKIIE